MSVPVVPVWPRTLPEPSRDYSIKRAATGVSGTKMESGYYRQRQEYEVHNLFVNVVLQVSHVDFQVFENFVQNTLQGGAMPFVGVYYDGELRKEGIVQIMGGDYGSPKPLGTTHWSVPFQLYVPDRVPALDDIALLYSSLKDYSDAELETIVPAIEAMMYANDLTNPNGVPAP